MNSLLYPSMNGKSIPQGWNVGKVEKRILGREAYSNFAILKILRLFYNDRIWCNHGRWCSDRNSSSMQSDPIINREGSLPQSEGPSFRRIQCPTRSGPSNNLRRCTWPILGSTRAIQQGWRDPQRTLHLPRRLRGSRLQFSLNSPSPLPLQAKIPLNDRPTTRKSLIPQHHLRLWILRWNSQKVRQS